MCPWKLNVNGHELNSNLKLTERENLINFQDAAVPFQLTINNSINDKADSSKSGRQIDIMKLEVFICSLCARFTMPKKADRTQTASFPWSPDPELLWNSHIVKAVDLMVDTWMHVRWVARSSRLTKDSVLKLEAVVGDGGLLPLVGVGLWFCRAEGLAPQLLLQMVDLFITKTFRLMETRGFKLKKRMWVFQLRANFLETAAHL